MRDRAVTQQEAVVEDERAVEPVENAGQNRREGRPAPGFPFPSSLSKKIFSESQNSNCKNGTRHAREEELENSRWPHGRAEHEPQHRETVGVKRPRKIRVLLVPALPDLRRAVSRLPGKIRPPGRDVAPVAGREVRRPVDVSPLVRLGPEVPERERRAGQGKEIRPAHDENGEEDRGGDGAAAAKEGRHGGF